MKMSPEPRHCTYHRRKWVRCIVAIALFALAFTLIAVYAGRPLLAMVEDPEAFRQWVQTQGIWGRIVFIGIRCLQTVITVLPAEAVEIGGGYAFGAVEGMVLCLVGSALGGAFSFWFTRRFGSRLVEVFVSREKLSSLKFMRSAKRLHLLLFLLFLIPGSPKDTLSYLAGLTPVKLPSFLLLSSLGRIPSVLTSTLGGNALGRQNYTSAILIFVFTAAISAAGVIIYRRIVKCEEKDQQTNG